MADLDDQVTLVVEPNTIFLRGTDAFRGKDPNIKVVEGGDSLHWLYVGQASGVSEVVRIKLLGVKRRGI